MKINERSVVCTLFEGTYHKGLAILLNSLYSSGFEGSFYAGYRGDLPLWAKTLKENEAVNSRISVHFIALDTRYHLTNYKPDFLLQLLDELQGTCESIYYLDPDIVIQAPWSFMEEWVHYGVALCEDLNSPLPEFHPRRMAWRSYFGESGFNLSFKDAAYVNGGFVGVAQKDFKFIELWKRLQEEMSNVIGGLESANLGKGKELASSLSSPLAPFSKTDQDALNATIEAYSGTCSLMGKEAMGFKAGFNILPHALGQPKPWDKKFLKTLIFQGRRPGIADKAYWGADHFPVQIYSRSKIYLKLKEIKLSSFFARFYRS